MKDQYKTAYERRKHNSIKIAEHKYGRSYEYDPNIQSNNPKSKPKWKEDRWTEKDQTNEEGLWDE